MSEPVCVDCESLDFSDWPFKLRAAWDGLINSYNTEVSEHGLAGDQALMLAERLHCKAAANLTAE